VGALFSRREYIQKPEYVKAKMNGQSAPGLDGFWFLDDGLTGGERLGVDTFEEETRNIAKSMVK